MPKYPSSLPASGQAAREWLLDLIFRDRKPLAWIASVKDVDAVGAWTGSRYGGRIALNPDSGHYVCIATIEPSATKRREDDVEAVNVVVLDDVGNDSRPDIKLDEDVLQLIPIPPSYVIETSSLNYQVGFVLVPPVSRQEYDALIADMKHHPELRDGIKDGTTSVRYVRLPSGVNPKPGKNAFATRLVEASGRTYSIGELRKAFNLVAPTTRTQAAPASVSADVPEALRLPEAQALALLAEIYAEIRNNGIGREDWIGLVFAAWNASGGSEGALAIIEAWTATREDGDVDPGKDIRDVWDHRLGTKAGVTTLIRGLEEYGRAGATAMIEKIKQVQAKGVFDPVDNGDGADTASPGGKGAKLPPILDWDSAKRGKVRTVQPMLFPGVDRNLLTVIAGPSGVLKSTLLMHVALAIVCERADIIGMPKIDYCGDVLIFANEDSEEITDKRLDAIQKHWGITGFRHKLYILSGKLFEKIPPTSNGKFVWRKDAFDRIKAVANQTRDAGRQLALVAIDTLSSVAAGSEETNREMQEIADLADDLIKEIGSAGLFVHHFRKAGTSDKDEEEPGLEVMRGGGAFGNTIRNVLFMTRPRKVDRDVAGWSEEEAREFVKVMIRKRNYGPDGLLQWYRRQIVAIPVIDPRDNSLHSEDYLVLLANPIDAAAAHERKLREAHAKITAANLAGRELVKMSKANGSSRSVQELLGLPDKETNKILDELARLGGVVFTERRDASRKTVQDVIATGSLVIPNDEETTEDEEAEDDVSGL